MNPCSQVQRNEVRSRERVLSDSEIPLFWAAFDGAGLAGTALKLILLLGQRPGEVSHMRFEHIDCGWWDMPGKAVPELGWPGTKNGETHRVWLPKPARALVAELDGDDKGFVLAGQRGGAVARLDLLMRAICANLGIDDKVTPHDLRRTHGTRITALGFGRDAMNRIQDVAMMLTIAVLGMALPLEAQASFVPPTVVPEPATLVMLATGLAGLGAAEFIRRRKKK